MRIRPVSLCIVVDEHMHDRTGIMAAQIYEITDEGQNQNCTQIKGNLRVSMQVLQLVTFDSLRCMLRQDPTSMLMRSKQT